MNFFRASDYNWAFYFWTYLIEQRYDPSGALMMALILSDKDGDLYNPVKSEQLFKIYLLSRYSDICLQDEKDKNTFFKNPYKDRESYIETKQRLWFLTLCEKDESDLFRMAKQHLKKDEDSYAPLIAYNLLKYLYTKKSYAPSKSLYIEIEDKIKGQN